MEMSSYLHAGAGLLIVLGLIVLVAFVARKLGFGHGGLSRPDRRLSIVESMSLDPKRRVLLIKCDYTEHLVLLGPNSETVLSGRANERSAQSAPTNASESPPRAPTVATNGPSMLTNKAPSAASKAQSSSSLGKRRSSDQARREPLLGPLPTDRRPK